MPFAPSEFYCKDGCQECRHDAHPRLREKLESMRDLYGKPMIVDSGWRCEKHNKAVGGKPDSEHLTGEAADIRCTDSRTRALMVAAALAVGFRRLGIGKTFIHLGVSTTHDQDVIWLY